MQLSKERMLEIAKALEFRSKNAEIKCRKCGTTLMQHSKEEVAFYEQVVQLLQTDAEGRLVVLPCNVGDTVWFVYEGKIHEMRVQGISVTQSRYIILEFGGYPVVNIWGDEVGKSVFLTKEEADEALERSNAR